MDQSESYVCGQDDIHFAGHVYSSCLCIKCLIYILDLNLYRDLLIREKVCIHTDKTECDVTNVILKNLKDSYTARIYSEIPYDEDNFETPQYEVSSAFVPYTQSKYSKYDVDSTIFNIFIHRKKG